jgi:hypothetical protein
MSVSVTGVPADIVNLIQDRTLERMFHDALFPRLLFRSEALPETWAANLGERMMFTRAGLIPVKTTPLTPGSDPVPGSYATEQWEAEARQFGDAIDTHMPTSYVSLASLYLRNTATLGLNAGETLNRLVRNALYNAYTAGNTNAIAAAAAAATQIRVANISGFTEKLVNGRPQPVGPSNPLGVTFSVSGEPANTVIGAVADDPANPFGPGTLFLGAGLTVGLSISASARSGVYADTRSRVLRVGGGSTVDALASTNLLTLQDVINACSILRASKVPPCSDGSYHVHLSPLVEGAMFSDNQLQRLFQSLPESMQYRDLAIGHLNGAMYYRNTETPNVENSGTLVATGGGSGSAQSGTEVHADVRNQNGVAIQRTIVMGGGAVYEKYLDESKYITEAGITGKIGEFQVTNGGVQVMTERIRFIARSPLDRLQQIYGQAWSWSGDFPVPSDQTTGSAARFKRAIVIESA